MRQCGKLSGVKSSEKLHGCGIVVKKQGRPPLQLKTASFFFDPQAAVRKEGEYWRARSVEGRVNAVEVLRDATSNVYRTAASRRLARVCTTRYVRSIPRPDAPPAGSAARQVSVFDALRSCAPFWPWVSSTRGERSRHPVDSRVNWPVTVAIASASRRPRKRELPCAATPAPAMMTAPPPCPAA